MAPLRQIPPKWSRRPAAFFLIRSLPRPQRRKAARQAGRSGEPRYLRVALASTAALLAVAGATVAAIHFGSAGPGHPAPSAGGTHHPIVTSPPGSLKDGSAPSTTLPGPQVVSGGNGSAYADYAVAATSIDVSMVVNQRCWVEVRDGSSAGPIAFEGTLVPGVSQNFQSAGGLWVRLGDPAGVTMAIDGAPVALPDNSAPFDVAIAGSTRA